MPFRCFRRRTIALFALGGLLLGACSTAGTRTNPASKASPPDATRSAQPQKAVRTTKALLGLASRARRCGSPVIASMGSSVAVVYYLTQVKGGTFRRNDNLMDGLARRAYTGRYPAQNVTCPTAFRRIRGLFDFVRQRFPRARKPIYRYAVSLLRSDGEYARVMARHRGQNRQVQRPRSGPGQRYRRWERVYKLPENAVDL